MIRTIPIFLNISLFFPSELKRSNPAPFYKLPESCIDSETCCLSELASAFWQMKQKIHTLIRSWIQNATPNTEKHEPLSLFKFSHKHYE